MSKATKGVKMLAGKYNRGFTEEKLKSLNEPKVKYDGEGHYIMTVSENVKVYFDDYYQFLEKTFARCLKELARVDQELNSLDDDYLESRSFYAAYRIILELVARNVRSFYTDGSNFGVIMTPWCFGTVVLEKLESYRERMAKGQIPEDKLPQNSYYIVRYLDEIHKRVLLDLFEFPPEAFKMRWQYSELLKRYSRVLQNISGSLQSVLMMVKSYGI